MQKRGGIEKNITVSGRPKSFANIDMVQSILIQDQEKEVPPYKVKVHLWTTVKVSKQS